MIEITRNHVYRMLEIFTAFLLLNLVWVLLCLLVRKWKSEGVDYGIIKPFFKLFKDNWQKSFKIGAIWSLLGLVIAIDFYLINELEFVGKIWLISLLLFCGMIYLFTTIYLFPTLVNYELPIKSVLKNALFYSLGKIGTTLLCVLTIALIFIGIYFFPLLLLVCGSLTAFAIYSICSFSFVRTTETL
jgi:uncharacterized membrane protein YesL